MVKRYPHKAIIYSKGGSVVRGEFVMSSATGTEITGRYDPSNNENLKVKNSYGNEIIPKAEFYTQSKQIQGAERIVIASLGIDEEIICWWQFQTHSVIYV